MISARQLVRLALTAVLGAALVGPLGGCVSLLPKTKPAQLYRFGAAAPAAQAELPGPNAVGVFWDNGAFQREAAGDRILTVTGDKVAYIADTRWAAPAQVLFQQAVEAAFVSTAGHVRLVPRGLPAPADAVLRVDVANFEARYDGKGAPTVLVRLHATLTRDRERSVVSEQVFEARVHAGDNRVSAIVAAFDKAVQDTLGQLVAWTNDKSAARANAA
jgi:cholesterol transport system auxiliary component